MTELSLKVEVFRSSNVTFKGKSNVLFASTCTCN